MFQRCESSQFSQYMRLSPFFLYAYTYDAAGNRLSNANLTDAALDQTYTYDALDRLTSDAQNGKTETWGLDSLGNWETFNNGSAAQSRTTDAAN
ncbi:MAG: hypothetical protein ACLQNE_45340, partial [Thermoguttaceae bacterium]